jgi:hypothetical protein
MRRNRKSFNISNAANQRMPTSTALILNRIESLLRHCHPSHSCSLEGKVSRWSLDLQEADRGFLLPWHSKLPALLEFESHIGQNLHSFPAYCPVRFWRRILNIHKLFISLFLLICPALASAQGCTVSGNSGDLPKKSVTGCAASLVNDNGKILSVGEDAQIKGPNPYVDIRSFGAKAINVNIPPAFATNNLPVSISAASSNATLCGGLSGAHLTTCQGYAANLSNGEGVYVQGAGIANSSATPAAPTVQAILPIGAMNTNLDVAGLTTGSTTYCYEVVGLRQGGGYTAASPSTCVTTAPASLGNQTVAISTLALSGSTLTVVTSAAHGVTIGALVNITGTSNDLQFSGWFNVNQVDSTTQFEIFNFQVNTLNGAPPSATGGTIQYHNGISIVEGTPDTTIFQYLVYGRSGGSFNFIGAMWPNDSLMVGDPTYNKFQDFGATESVAQGLISYLPATAPSVAMNDGLSTTIASGGGTTTLTLANPAVNTVSGTFIVHDDVPAFNAAFAAFGVVKIPAAGSNFIINSYLKFPSGNGKFVQQAGSVTINATVQLNGTWSGDVGPNSNTSVGGFESLPFITVNSGFPAFYCGPGVSGQNCDMRGITIGVGNNPNSLIFMTDAGGANIPVGFLDRVQFALGAVNDYVSCAILMRDINISGSTQIILNNVTVAGGPFPQTLKSTAPLIQTSGGSGIEAKGILFMTRRGIWFRPPTTGDMSSFDSIYCEGCIAPNIWAGVTGSSGTFFNLSVNNITQDTSFLPIFVGLTTGLIGNVTINNTNGAGGSNPSISGNGARLVYTLGSGSFRSGGTNFANDGIYGRAQGTYSNEVHNLGVQIGTGYSLFSEGGQPPAPTCTPATGTLSAVATYSLSYAPRYPNGSDGARSYSCSVLTTTGNQAIQMNWPAIPGAVGYDTWVGTPPPNQAAKSCFPSQTTTTNSYLDLQPSLVCGGSPIQVSAGGPVGLNYQQMWTPKLTIGGEALTALPRGEQNIFLPGALTSTWTGSTWTTDKAIIVTRVQAQAKTEPVRCSANAIVRLTNGTAPVNLTIAAAANDTGAITQNYAAGSVLTFGVQVAAAGCATSPADVNVTIQYRMQ